MKTLKTLPLFMMFLGALAAAGENARNNDWIRSMRMVKVEMPSPVSRPPVQPGWEEKLKTTLEELRKSGVNTIIDHGSFQFMPGLPRYGRAQWTQPVEYEYAIPFSRAVKAAGMRLFHHTTSTFVPHEAMTLRPECGAWVSLDVNTGEVALHKSSYKDAVFMDMNHPDFRKLIFSRMAEYAAKCQVDGFQTDEVEWLPNEYASGSKAGSHRLYRERFGKDMPKGKMDAADPDWRRYIAFRFASGGDFYTEELKALRAVNPAMKLSGCLAGISSPSRRIWAMGNSDWLKGWNVGFFEMEQGVHPRGKRGGFLGSSYYPSYYREMALYNGYAEVYGWSGNYAIGYPSTWKVGDSEQFLLWAMTELMGFRYEMRDYQAEVEWFAWEEKHERDLIGPRRIANVGIYFPEKERDFQRDPGKAYRNWSGIGEALAAEYVVADQLVAAHFDRPELLERFDLIVLPGDSFIPENVRKALEAFVARGGTLLAAGISNTLDPFAAPEGQPNQLLELLGVAEIGTETTGKATAAKFDKAIPALTGRVIVVNAPGLTRVKPLPSSRVAARSGQFPAVIVSRHGKGRTVFIPACWGDRLYSHQIQRGTKFRQTADGTQRKMLADLVRALLPRGLTVEAENLPAKFMFNAFDTTGYDDGSVCRTIHVLDCFDGYEKGEEFPPENRPCRFKPLAERNGGKEVVFTVRNFPKIKSVRLLSPDHDAVLPVKFAAGEEPGTWKLTVPAGDFGRYTVIVCDPEERG